MLYDYQLEIAAVILSCLALFVCEMRRGYPTRSNRIFIATVLCNLISSVFNTFSVFTLTYASVVPLWANYLVNGIFLFFHGVTVVCFFLYFSYSLGRDSYHRYAVVIATVVSAYLLIAVVTSPWSHAVFYFDESFSYCHGPLFYTMYVLAGLVVIYALLTFYSRRKMLSGWQKATLAFYVLSLATALTVNANFPSIMVEDFAVSIFLILLYVSLEDPSEYMYRSTYCFNRHAFLYGANDLLERNVPFSALGVGFEDASYMRRILDDTIIKDRTEQLIDLLHEKFGQRRVFCLEHFRFVILCETYEQVDEAVRWCRQNMPQVLRFEGLPRGMQPCFVKMSNPGFAKTADQALWAIEFGLNNHDEHGSTYAKEASIRSLRTVEQEGRVMTILRDALANDSLQVAYQPIRSIESGRFPLCEALVRLADEDGSFVNTQEFVSLAEANGLASEMGEQVLRKVCAFIAENDLEALGVECVHVNLSLMQCMDTHMAETVIGVMNEHGIDPAFVDFEITETATTRDLDPVRRGLAALRANGSSISLDDYGTGYASLGYLVDVAFDNVKIDKSILRSAMVNERARAVLRNSVSLVRDLGGTCIAEGIETPEMAEMAAEVGCTALQGFLYSQPLLPDAFLEFVKAGNGSAGVMGYRHAGDVVSDALRYL